MSNATVFEPRVIVDQEGSSAEFDNKFSIPITIDNVHHEIHEGDHFEAHFESGASQVAGIACGFRIAPGLKEVHMVIDWKVTDRAYIEILEGAIWDTNTGTVITPVNNNRINVNTSIMQEDKTTTPTWTSNGMLLDPTNITGGTQLHQDEAYTAKQAGGTTGLPRHEWILNPGQTYVIRIIKRSAGNIYMGFVPHWYEHTPD